MKKRLLCFCFALIFVTTFILPSISFALSSQSLSSPLQKIMEVRHQFDSKKHDKPDKPDKPGKPIQISDEAPADEAPADETPVDETPVDETPVDETPVDETPVDETPVDETPVDETPVDETPVDETPIDETPVVLEYLVNIGALYGGVITANVISAEAGANVSLVITPDEGMQLKAGTLKFNGIEIIGSSFVMPEGDVLISAEFEPIPSVSYYEDDFEGAIKPIWEREMADRPYAGTISSQYAFAGSSSLRVELHDDDPIVCASKRSELTLLSHDEPLAQRTYNFAILLPDGGDEDFAYDYGDGDIIAQWHNVPDPGEAWTYPPLALHTEDGKYELVSVWDDAEMSTNQQIFAKHNIAYYNLGSYLEDKGRWVQWSFRIKWGWLDSHNPRIEVFKDGELVLDVKGPNTTNDRVGPHQKLGLYKWIWAQGEDNDSTVSQRVVYYDDFSVQ